MSKVMIYKNVDGMWCARKQYEMGKWSVPYMFSYSSNSLKFKLVEDGEEEDNIYVCEEKNINKDEENNYG